MTTYIEDIKLCKKKYGGLNRLKTVRDILQKHVDQDNKDVILYLIFRHNFFRHYGNPGRKNNIPLEKNFKLKVIYQIYKYSAKYLSLQTADELKRYQDFDIEFNNNLNEKTKIRDKYKDIKNLIKVKKLLLKLDNTDIKIKENENIFEFLDTKKDYESKLNNINLLSLDEQLYYKYRLNRIYRILDIDFKFETPFKNNFNKINAYLDSIIYKCEIAVNNYRILYLNYLNKFEANYDGIFVVFRKKLHFSRKAVNKMIKKYEKRKKNLENKLFNLNIDPITDFRLLGDGDEDFIIQKLNRYKNRGINGDGNDFDNFNDIYEEFKDDINKKEAINFKNEYEKSLAEGEVIINLYKSKNTYFTDFKKTPKINYNDKIMLLIANLRIKTMSENPILIFEDDIQKIFKDNKNISNEINSRSSIVNNKGSSNLLNNLVPAAIGLFALYKKFKK